jgi:TRAP-type C4-dicarboxylate transport system substrate-binding protein
MKASKLGAASLLVLGAIALGGGTAAAQQHTWTVGGINPPNAPVTIAAQRFADLVTERTNGRIKVNYFGGSQLGSGPQQIEAMANGAQEGYISSGSNASKLVKEFGVIDTAFLFESKEHFLKFMDSDLVADLKARLAKEFNVRIIATNWFRLPRAFTTKNACVTGPEDIAGKRARSPNLPMYIKSWEMMGTVPVTTAYGEAYMAIKQGLVDMTESAGEQVFSSKYYELLPYVTEAEIMYPQNSVYIAEHAWSKISDGDKEIVRKAAFDAGDHFTKLVQDRVAPERKKMMSAGTTFCKLPAAARAEFQAMVAKRVPELEKLGLMPKGWWDKIQAMK